ncbi:DUF6998 domain-containing protein [Microbulbifer variabilis]|uniref:DUF6998 domain-containing protein n=1 Tax=Microbulbifer variabilis TaxID=266805 RepID=UPI001CFD2AB4|nr:hypothetical protein [Microbulbifer variabilis]
MNHKKFQSLVQQLYSTVSELEAMFPGRHFTPDGHMVGSIGECLVADAYDLKLMPASNKGYDAVTATGKQIEIKATQSKSASFRSEPEYAIVIKILSSGEFEEIYNGPGRLIWEEFSGKPLPSNGQYQISLNKLKVLNNKVDDLKRLPKIPKNP